MTDPAEHSVVSLPHWLRRRLWIALVGGLLVGFIWYHSVRNDPLRFPGVVAIEQGHGNIWDFGYLPGIGEYKLLETGGPTKEVWQLHVDGRPSFDITRDDTEFDTGLCVLPDAQGRIAVIYGNSVTLCDQSGAKAIWKLKAPEACPKENLRGFDAALVDGKLAITLYTGDDRLATHFLATYEIPDSQPSTSSKHGQAKLDAVDVRTLEKGLLRLSPDGHGWAQLVKRSNKMTFEDEHFLVLSDGREAFIPWPEPWIQYIDDDTLLLNWHEDTQSGFVEIELAGDKLNVSSVLRNLPDSQLGYGARPVPNSRWLLIIEDDYRNRELWKWQYDISSLKFFLYDRQREHVVATHQILSTDWSGGDACPYNGIAFDDLGRYLFLSTSKGNEIMKIDLHKWIQACGGDVGE